MATPIEQLPTPDELMAAPEWGGLDAAQRSEAVDAWALETRAAHPWSMEENRALDSAVDDFHGRAAEGWGEWAGRKDA
jgi:hypothetical protein